MYRENGDPELHNSILWNNSADSVVDGWAQFDGGGTVFYVTNSCIDHVEDFAAVLGATNNIGDDPLFVNATGGDLHLQASSPGLDLGLNSYVPTDETDADGDADVDEATPDADLNARGPKWGHSTLPPHGRGKGE